MADTPQRYAPMPISHSRSSIHCAAIALSVVLGFWLGAVLHALPRARRVFEPLLAAYYAVPVFVFYPLLIVAFGVGRTALIVMGAMFGIVAMIVNTMIGLDRVPSVISRAAVAMRLNPLHRLLLVRLPAASPHLVTGIKLAVAYSVIGIVAGEFILATAGIGKRIAFGYQDFDNRTMYGMLLLLLILVMSYQRSRCRFGRSDCIVASAGNEAADATMHLLLVAAFWYVGSPLSGLSVPTSCRLRWHDHAGGRADATPRISGRTRPARARVRLRLRHRDRGRHAARVWHWVSIALPATLPIQSSAPSIRSRRSRFIRSSC